MAYIQARFWVFLRRKNKPYTRNKRAASSKAKSPTKPVSMPRLAISDEARSKLRLQTTVWFKSGGLMPPNTIPVVPGPAPKIACFGPEAMEFLTKVQVVLLDSWISIGRFTLTRLRGLTTGGRNWKATNKMEMISRVIGFQSQLPDVCDAPVRIMLRARSAVRPKASASQATNALIRKSVTTATTVSTTRDHFLYLAISGWLKNRHCRKITLKAAKIARPAKLPMGLNPLSWV